MLKYCHVAPHKVLLSGSSPRILGRKGGVPFQMGFGKSEIFSLLSVLWEHSGQIRGMWSLWDLPLRS